MLTYRVRRKGFRWTAGGFKTFEDAVAYAKKDWAFADRSGNLYDNTFFQYEIFGKAYRFDMLDSPVWAS